MARMTKTGVCARCGDRVADHYLEGGLCYSCHLDTYIPRGYQRAEKYEWDELWEHWNATCRPALGVPFLDRDGPEMRGEMLMAKRKPPVQAPAGFRAGASWRGCRGRPSGAGSSARA